MGEVSLHMKRHTRRYMKPRTRRYKPSQAVTSRYKPLQAVTSRYKPLHGEARGGGEEDLIVRRESHVLALRRHLVKN